MITRRSRIVLLAAAVAVFAGLNVARPWADPAPATELGTAGVELGDDTARAVEEVTYRQNVERIGDVIVVAGAPRDPLSADLAAMWEIVDAVWPTTLRGELAQLSVVREEPRGLVGVVHPSVTGGWILSLDIADIDDRALIEETIVHELSHVVTLDREVFTFGGVDDCSGVQLDLGCAAQGSVLAVFAERFWPDDAPSPRAGDHVNAYASTGAHEDLAETFTAWVLGWPVDSATVAAKIELLAADPDLASLADDLRARLLA